MTASLHCAEAGDDVITRCPYIEMYTREQNSVHKTLETMNSTLTTMSIDIALLKYKSGLFGAVAGLIPGIISALAVYLNSQPHAIIK